MDPSDRYAPLQLDGYDEPVLGNDHYTCSDTPVSTRPHSPSSGHDSPFSAGHDGRAVQGGSDAGLVPVQKRRRVTRACDECRRKKIKCDGKQPCPHCLVYSYECTYDKPSNRRRNPTPQYIGVLERKLRRAEMLLQLVSPAIDLNDTHIDDCLEDGADSIEAVLQELAIRPRPGPAAVGKTEKIEPDGGLESMVKSTGQLDLDGHGHMDYFGGSSGFLFARKMRERLNSIIGSSDPITPSCAASPKAAFEIPGHVFSSPRYSVLDSPQDSSGADLDPLPPANVARFLCDLAINDAGLLLRAVHLPSFQAGFDRLYGRSPSQYTNDDHTFLPLFYSLLALGSLYARDENSELDSKGYTVAIGHGFRYYKAATRLIDVTDCRDLNSLAAVTYLIQFLQSSARLSTCYSFVGCAMRSALRMGLHRKLDGVFNPVDAEVRKRVFWVLRRMDIHISTLLGLPYLLNDDDIDQELPSTAEDEDIRPDGIHVGQSGPSPVMVATRAHIGLLPIMMKAVKHIYPVRPLSKAGSFLIPSTIVCELETDLRAWKEALPDHLRPGVDQPISVVRAQQWLRLSYAHIQVMIYRPFLHYISRSDNTMTPNKLSYAYAATCVSVSRNIVHIVTEMNRQHLLIGAYWFAMYTTFFAVLSLIFFVLESPEDESVHNALQDAYEGKITLAHLANRSLAADRCTAILKALFGRLPDHLLSSFRDRRVPLPTRKRSLDVSPDGQPGQSGIQSGLVSPSTTYKPASTFDSRPTTTSTTSIDEAQTTDPVPVSNSIYMHTGDGLDFLLQESAGQSSQDLTSTASASEPERTSQLASGLSRSFSQNTGLIFPDGDPFAYPQHSLNLLLSDNLDLVGFEDCVDQPFTLDDLANPSMAKSGLTQNQAPLTPAGQAGISSQAGSVFSRPHASADGDANMSGQTMSSRAGGAMQPTHSAGLSEPSYPPVSGFASYYPSLELEGIDTHVPLPDPMPSYMFPPNTLLASSMHNPSSLSTVPNSLESLPTATFSNLAGPGISKTGNSAMIENLGTTGYFNSLGLSNGPSYGSSTNVNGGGQFDSQNRRPAVSTGTLHGQVTPLTSSAMSQQVTDPGLAFQQKMLRSLQFDPLAYYSSTGSVFPPSVTGQSSGLASGDVSTGFNTPIQR